VLFYAYMSMLLCDCQSFIKESYLLTYLPAGSLDLASMHDPASIRTCQNRHFFRASPARTGDQKGVCPSVKRVHCDKTE